MLKGKDEFVVGLDIGTSKIAMAVGTLASGGKVTIKGLKSYPVSDSMIRGELRNVDIATKTIKRLIADFENGIMDSIGSIIVNISSSETESEFYKTSLTRSGNDNIVNVGDIIRMNEDISRTNIKANMQMVFSMPLLYQVDNQDKSYDPVGHTGNRLDADFNLICCGFNPITNINKAVQRCSDTDAPSIERVLPSSIASSLAVLSEEEIEGGCVLVDLGAGVTNIAIYQDRLLVWAGVLPMGSNLITNDIVEGCSIPKTQAEQLKVNWGNAIPDPATKEHYLVIEGNKNRKETFISQYNLARIINARVEEIATFVLKYVYEFELLNRLHYGIVLTGGGANLNGITNLFKQVTGLDCRKGNTADVIANSKDEQLRKPEFSTAIGLVRSGFFSIDARENAHADATREFLESHNGVHHYSPVISKPAGKKTNTERSAQQEQAPPPPKKRSPFADLTKAIKTTFLDSDDDSSAY
jgi:cell division protein FtsA